MKLRDMFRGIPPMTWEDYLTLNEVGAPPAYTGPARVGNPDTSAGNLNQQSLNMMRSSPAALTPNMYQPTAMGGGARAAAPRPQARPAARPAQRAARPMLPGFVPGAGEIANPTGNEPAASTGSSTPPAAPAQPGATNTTSPYIAGARGGTRNPNYVAPQPTVDNRYNRNLPPSQRVVSAAPATTPAAAAAPATPASNTVASARGGMTQAPAPAAASTAAPMAPGSSTMRVGGMSGAAPAAPTLSANTAALRQPLSASKQRYRGTVIR